MTISLEQPAFLTDAQIADLKNQHTIWRRRFYALGPTAVLGLATVGGLTHNLNVTKAFGLAAVCALLYSQHKAISPLRMQTEDLTRKANWQQVQNDMMDRVLRNVDESEAARGKSGYAAWARRVMPHATQGLIV
jgi:hypothetical protein